MASIDQEIDILYVVNLFIGLGIVLAILLSLYYMFTGGISLILSGGQDDKIKESVNTIRYAVIGLVMTILAVASMYLFGNLFGVDVFEHVNPDRIFEALRGFFDRLINGADSSGF
jgi:hypothetical protein